MRHNTRFLLCFLVLGLFLSLSDTAVYPQETAKEAEQLTETDLCIDNAKESTVRLVGLRSGGIRTGGTGFFVASDKIATNFHVVAATTIGPIFAKLGHKETIWAIEGIMAFDAKGDIAILKVKGEGVPMSLADIKTLQIGETVFLAGYPNLQEYKVTAGVVKDIRGSDKWLKTTLEAYPGNSGSPVLNSKGAVIGIHVGHGYDARPSSALKTLLVNSTSTEPLEQWRNRMEQWRNRKKDAEAYKKRGKARAELGDYAEAIEDYSQALKLNPDAEVYKKRGKARAELGDYAEAIEDYSQALKLNPDAEVYKKRGKARAELGDYAEAIEDYSQALKLNPKDVFTYGSRADIKRQLGDYTGAIEDYNQAIKNLKDGSFTYQTYTEHGLRTTTITPDDSFICSIYNDRGWMKRKQGDHIGAMEDYTRAIELNPNHTSGYKNRAGLKHELGDYTGAVDDYNQVIKLKPDDAVAYNHRGKSKSELGDHADAIADYDKAIELNPKYDVAYHNRGLAKEALGQHQAAQSDFEKARN